MGIELETEVTDIGQSSNDIYNSKDSIISLEILKEQVRLQQEELLQQKDMLHDRYINLMGQNSWSFTQGLIIGQFSVIVVILIFIKFFVFADASTITSSASSSKDISGIIVKKDKTRRSEDDSQTAENEDELQKQIRKSTTILEKTYYDVNNHALESLDWFNVLIAQTISQLRTEALVSDNIYHSLNEFLSSLELPDYLDKIKLTEIDIGDDFPIFSNCRIKHSKDGSGRLEAKIDVDLSDTLTLGINTRLLLNHPVPLTAILPVELSVSIVRFSGCLTVSLINTNDQEFSDLNVSNNTSDSSEGLTSDLEAGVKSHKKNQEPIGTALMFSFSPDYRLEFTVKSLIGSRAKLQDVPKISSLIENKLRSWFIERCIEPRFQVVKVPSLWPRRKNTREPVHPNGNTEEKNS